MSEQVFRVKRLRCPCVFTMRNLACGENFYKYEDSAANYLLAWRWRRFLGRVFLRPMASSSSPSPLPPEYETAAAAAWIITSHQIIAHFLLPQILTPAGNRMEYSSTRRPRRSRRRGKEKGKVNEDGGGRERRRRRVTKKKIRIRRRGGGTERQGVKGGRRRDRKARGRGRWSGRTETGSEDQEDEE